MAFEVKLKNIEPDEQAVFELLLEIGPACDRRILEALNQKESRRLIHQSCRRRWEINQVCGRRNGLVKLGVVRDMGFYSGTWYGKKKRVHFWKVAGDIRKPPDGWTKYEGKVAKKYRPPLKEEVKSKEMTVREAAQRLVEWRHLKGHRAAQPTKQYVLFR